MLGWGFLPCHSLPFSRMLSNSRGDFKVMLPKVLKEKKYQCNEERSNCIFILCILIRYLFSLGVISPWLSPLPHAHSSLETCPLSTAEPLSTEEDWQHPLEARPKKSWSWDFKERILKEEDEDHYPLFSPWFPTVMLKGGSGYRCGQSWWMGKTVLRWMCKALRISITHTHLVW